MAGINPYITPPEIEPPTTKYRIKFLPMDIEIEVDPTKIPYGRTGQPGSILDIALTHGIDIDRHRLSIDLQLQHSVFSVQDLLPRAGAGLTQNSPLPLGGRGAG